MVAGCFQLFKRIRVLIIFLKFPIHGSPIVFTEVSPSLGDGVQEASSSAKGQLFQSAVSTLGNVSEMISAICTVETSLVYSSVDGKRAFGEVLLQCIASNLETLTDGLLPVGFDYFISLF